MWTAWLAAWLIGQAVSFEDALSQARALPAVRADERAQDARAKLAGETSRLLENPLLQVQPGGRHMSKGGAGAEVYVAINQRFSLTGAGAKRRAALARETAHDAALVGVSLRQARRRIAEAWLDRWMADQARDVSQREVVLADELLSLMNTTFQAGEATLVDVSAARTWRAEALLSELNMEGLSFEAGVALARALGAQDGEPRGTSSELPTIDLPEERLLHANAARVDDTVPVIAARAEQAREQAHLAEIKAAKGPSFGLGAMAWREGGGDVAAIGMLEVQLPLFDHGERERATQAAVAERARGQAQDAVLEQRSERVRLLHDLQHTRAVAEALDQQLLAAATALADAQHKRFQAREATAQDWVIARRRVLSASIELIKARAAVVLTRFLVAESFASGTERAGRDRAAEPDHGTHAGPAHRQRPTTQPASGVRR